MSTHLSTEIEQDNSIDYSIDIKEELLEPIVECEINSSSIAQDLTLNKHSKPQDSAINYKVEIEEAPFSPEEPEPEPEPAKEECFIEFIAVRGVPLVENQDISLDFLEAQGIHSVGCETDVVEEPDDQSSDIELEQDLHNETELYSSSDDDSRPRSKKTKKIFLCQVCDRTFAFEKALAQHMEKIHSIVSDDKKPMFRSSLPRDAKEILRNWLEAHVDNPYPTPADKIQLCKETKLALKKLNDWFINARRRYLPIGSNRITRKRRRRD